MAPQRWTNTQKINHFGLNHNHRQSVEDTRKKVIGYIEQGVKYKVRNGTKNYGRPFLQVRARGNILPWCIQY